MVDLFGALLLDILGRAELRDDRLDPRERYHRLVVLLVENQLGNTCLDVGDDLIPAVGLFVEPVEFVEIVVQRLDCLGVHREGYARKADIFSLFHDSC